MSALTVTDTLSVDAALAVVRDILAQTDGDAVVLALLRERPHAGYGVVGPLAPEEGAAARCSLLGQVGCVSHVSAAVAAPNPERWRWWLTLGAYAGREHPTATPSGYGETREAADAAMVAALTALGWHCVGAP